MDNAASLLEAVMTAAAALFAVAKAVVVLTDTPRDDEALGKAARLWAKVYPVLETIALVVGKAKQRPGEANALKQLEAEVALVSSVQRPESDDRGETLPTAPVDYEIAPQNATGAQRAIGKATAILEAADFVLTRVVK